MAGDEWKGVDPSFGVGPQTEPAGFLDQASGGTLTGEVLVFAERLLGVLNDAMEQGGGEVG